jgi:hypothetical protein
MNTRFLQKPNKCKICGGKCTGIECWNCYWDLIRGVHGCYNNGERNYALKRQTSFEVKFHEII